MVQNTGIIKVIQIDENGERTARISCPTPMVPAPGKYILADNPKEPETPISQALFQVGLLDPLEDDKTPLLGPIPASWHPGTVLHFRGPYGKGFSFSPNLRRLVLVSLGGGFSRLLPLIPIALGCGADVTIFTPPHLLPGKSLPLVVEINPLSTLPENLGWANMLVLDTPAGMLTHLRKTLGLEPHDRLPCQAQVLVNSSMPCGSLADCGACAIPARNGGYKLVCKEGPVFDLNQIDW
jgi:hypothetical protein